jgi:DNA sulfur modification protein DndC
VRIGTQTGCGRQVLASRLTAAPQSAIPIGPSSFRSALDIRTSKLEIPLAHLAHLVSTSATETGTIATMSVSDFQQIRDRLRQLYLEDTRPWLVGFSGGKDSMLVSALVFETVLPVPAEQRTKPVSILCTDTRVEIPAISEGVENVLDRMRRFSQQEGLNIEAQLLKPPPEQSFWVNIIGRGYPPPNRVFRWCTQRLKIDPVTTFVQMRMANGHWSEAILHLGARRAESSSRAQTMAGRERRNGLNRHPDLPRVWVSNPIEFLTTEEVWAYLLQKPNPWGGDNRPPYKLYASASNGECPIQIDTSTPSCGHSRFGCWTCTVVERDKASEGLLPSGDAPMQDPIAIQHESDYTYG